VNQKIVQRYTHFVVGFLQFLDRAGIGRNEAIMCNLVTLLFHTFTIRIELNSNPDARLQGYYFWDITHNVLAEAYTGSL